MNRGKIRDKIQEIQKEEVIQKWIEDTAKSTQNNYLNSMAQFSILTTLTPTQMLEIAEKEQDMNLPTRKKQLKTWLDSYKNYLYGSDLNYSIHTANVKKTAVISFFHFYEIDTPKDYKKRRKTHNLTVKNEREGLTHEQIKQAVNSAKSLKLKAIILAHCSSGLAAIDLLNITLDQFYDGLIKVDEDREICRIYNKRQKTEIHNSEHYTFFSYEAVKMIKDYLKYERINHEGYLFSAGKTLTRPLTVGGYCAKLRTLNKSLMWTTDKGKYNEVTSHMFRKFFNTQLADAKLNEEQLKHLMGWKLTDIRKHYYLANPEVLLESYINHLDCLTIMESVETITIESEAVKEYIKENEKLVESNRNLEDRMIKLEESHAKTSEIYELLDDPEVAAAIIQAKARRLMENK